MSNDLESLIPVQSPTAERPLLGLNVLIVEDSRFASEALRLLCLRSGARIRRADNLMHARKHLRVYRPNVVIVDLGLPDGSGADLIDELAHASARVDVVLGMSGDTGTEIFAMAAGADAFIEKPIANLGVFQEIILNALPESVRPMGIRPVSNEDISPDPIALQDDFIHISDLMTLNRGEDMLDYIAQFLSGIARTSGDTELDDAAKTLATHREQGKPFGSDVARVAGLVHERIDQARVV
ncbi:response regulator receiver domain-containing protein [Pacificibacter maritimus]|uniref:Response regulator receiver domain-containing protein n=1 Tax=Pacificibacter maritimus TaxID=762213 RepID=A0A3N4UMV6_9RHOB|nr:response regulator [Pacificibacter maritimus]RPE66387.1 response regulator receiver domain-containing protein [Pacificibacter maritimus]